MNDITKTLFFNFGEKYSSKFESLRKDLIMSNTGIILQHYLSMMIFYTLLSFFFSLILSILGYVLTGSISFIFFLFLPFLVLIIFYLYPTIKKNSLKNSLDEELPFATIYMAAIISADLEPLRMFKLIANSREYKNLSIEIKKLLNQTEIYGYDLATALRNSAKNCPSQKLAELFSGLATNISSGGSLKNYLQKKADNLLIDYRLEREKYNATADTLMNIYVSLLIAAPLIFMVVLSVMAYSGIKIGLDINFLIFGIIVIVSILNIILLIYIEIKRPKD